MIDILIGVCIYLHIGLSFSSSWVEAGRSVWEEMELETPGIRATTIIVLMIAWVPVVVILILMGLLGKES